MTYTGTIPESLQNYFEEKNGTIDAKDAAYVDANDHSKGMSSDLISALKTWAGTQTALVTGTVSAGNTNLKFDKLPYGYYYISSTIGAAIAVTTTDPDPSFTDKSEAPTVDKTITAVKDSRGSVKTEGDDTDSIKKNKAAIAEAGSTVSFEAPITVKKGAHNYVFKDTMSAGLKLDTSSIKVYVRSGAEDTEVTQETAGTYYTIDTTAVTAQTAENNNYTFKITFVDSYLQGLLKDNVTSATLVVKYDAEVTSDALQTTPASNDVRLDYGDNHTTTHADTKVYNAKLTIKKVDGNNQPLEGASFKLYKLGGTDSKTKLYYKETTGTNGEKSISWVTDGTETQVGATKADGETDYTASFSGLANGTYYIEESVTPSGYNTAGDQQITINDANTTKNETIGGTEKSVTPFSTDNLQRTATVINKTGSLLPSTGGIGTTIFYVIGGVLIAGAAILLITRRKKA